MGESALNSSGVMTPEDGRANMATGRTAERTIHLRYSRLIIQLLY
jgi:hypothetical protein